MKELNDHDKVLLDLYASIIIGQARIYDVMLTMLQKQDAKAAEMLLEFHREGNLRFPPPSVRVDDDI